ncbi:MAG: 6-bladed beta-propeller [Prevotellaceae bacterium]|jgi:hypothetical protein|nr:6-bladed beta-propeller [Prevotellaceae bacterium]
MIGMGNNPNILNISVYPPYPVDVKALFSDIGFIKLDTSSKAYMYMPFTLRVLKDKIYILDIGVHGAVLMFDISGKFIRKIGEIGRGPGELLSMHGIEIDYNRNRLYITDNSGSQTVAFDLDGNYLFSVPLGDIGGFNAITPSGNIVNESFNSSFGYDFKNMVQRENIKILDTTGKVLMQGFEYNHSRKINAMFKTLSVSESGHVTFCPVFCDTIYSVTESSITPLYSFDFSKVKPISLKRANTYSDSRDMMIDLMQNGYVCLGGAHLDTPDVLYVQLGFGIDRAHLFYNKNNGTTNIIKLRDPTTSYQSLFNGASSAWMPYSISDFNDGYFYGMLEEGEQMKLMALNPPKGSFERKLLDSMDPSEHSLYIIYFKCIE